MRTPSAPAAAPERIWLKSYPRGVPAEVDIYAFSSIPGILEASVARYAAYPAYSNMGRTLTYRQVDRRARDFAAFLQSELGHAKGDRIAIMMPNLLQYPVALFGALRAGLVVTSVNPQYTARELEYQLCDAGAKTIVVLENFCHVLAEVMARTPVKTVITTGVGDLLRWPRSFLVNFAVRRIKRLVPRCDIGGRVSLSHALRVGRRRPLQPVDITLDDLAFIQYTAGTTGRPKGVMLSHGNIVANLQQASAWIAPFAEDGKEVVITPLPLYHIFSMTANCLLFMKHGGHIRLITDPRDLKGFVRVLKGVRFSVITGVNTLFRALSRMRGFATLDLSGLKITLGGGMPIHRSVAERWHAVTGHVLIEAYGLTEASPGVCINPIDLKAFNGKVGLPLPSTECAIADASGQALPVGEVGELWVRGPQVMRGYWNNPDANARVLTKDGWLRTGDVARMDEAGFFEIVDRTDDLIVVGGFNVYPSEIESVVAGHAGVAEVGAVGVPHERYGEIVKVVVARTDPDLTEKVLRDYCRRYLASYKVPRQIEFRDSLPKSHLGKVLRRALR